MGLTGAEATASLEDGAFVFEARLPVATLFPKGVPARLLFNAWGYQLRKGNDEPHFAGLTFFSVFRPFTWGWAVPGD